MRAFLAALSVIFLAGTVHAACPNSPPSPPNYAKRDGDQPVPASWLRQNLSGKKVYLSGEGTEHYRANGAYTYSNGGQSWNAPAYKFYENSVRCIGYGNPRFDYYISNGGNLYLINYSGNRLLVRAIR